MSLLLLQKLLGSHEASKSTVDLIVLKDKETNTTGFSYTLTTPYRPQLDHSYCSKFTALEQKLKKEVKRLGRKLARKEERISGIAKALQDLKKEKLLSKEFASVLEGQFTGLPLQLFKNQKKNQTRSNGCQYDDEVKKFSLTLNYYSPRAYRFLRSVFKLPHPRTLKTWASSVDAAAGHLLHVYKKLSERVEQDPYAADCSLIVDGMHLSEDTSYDQVHDCFSGYVDYGNRINLEGLEETLAREAICFLLNGLCKHFKVPVAYFFVSRITSEIQARLIQMALLHADEFGLKVHTVTLDGAKLNPASLSLLGMSWKSDSLDGKLDSDLIGGQEVYAVLDNCHMIKLSRNCLGDLKVLQDSDGREIKWQHIQNLVELQDKEGLKFANKLGPQHVSYRRNKMKVQLATQVVSASVADALEFLQELDVPGFHDCEGTVTFLRNLDLLFDLLNSRSQFGAGHKGPLTKQSQPWWENQLNELSEYILGLTDAKGQPIKDHSRGTFVKGFSITAKSVSTVSAKLLHRVDNPFQFVCTFNFSQDPIETYFNTIRSRGGCNRNPTTAQFNTSLQQTLLHNFIRATSTGNCLSFEDESNSGIFSFGKRKKEGFDFKK